MTEPDPDGMRFSRDACHVLNAADRFLNQWFGPECQDFEPERECCKRWAHLHALLENPWQKELNACWAELHRFIREENDEICDELGVPRNTWVCTRCRQQVRSNRHGQLGCDCCWTNGPDMGGDGEGI